MDQRTSKESSPTAPLAKIDEVLEDSDEVWLDDQVIEPTVTLSSRHSSDGNDSSPLERLVKSISSEGEQWPVEERQGREPSPTMRSLTKAYYDPTRPSRETKTRERSEGSIDHDSDDEVNTSPNKRLVEDTENAVAPFTSVVFYRYLFGKGFGNFKKAASAPPEANVDDTLHEIGLEMGEESENDDSSITGSYSLANDRDGEVEESAKTEKAENLPLFLMGRVKSLFSRNARGGLESSNVCPVCGNDLNGLTLEEVNSRMKAIKTGHVQWLGEKYARLVSPYPKEVYKTEIRIEADGSRSLSESYYRGPKPF